MRTLAPPRDGVTRGGAGGRRPGRMGRFPRAVPGPPPAATPPAPPAAALAGSLLMAAALLLVGVALLWGLDRRR